HRPAHGPVMTAKSLVPSLLLVSIVFGSAACQQVKSANPLSPDVAGPIPGVSISAPLPVEPIQGAQVVADGQPTTLVFENSATTGERPMWMQFGIASDTNFQQVVHPTNS